MRDLQDPFRTLYKEKRNRDESSITLVQIFCRDSAESLESSSSTQVYALT